MDKEEIAPGIVVYKNVIDDYKTLVDDIEDGMVSAKKTWVRSSIKNNEGVYVDTDARDTFALGIPYNDFIIDDFLNVEEAFNGTLSNIFLSAFQRLEHDYKREYQFETAWHDQYSILKYGVGQKFINHIDDHKDIHRAMSVVYYINDDYLGGEIVFPRFNIKYKPNANELLIFPSAYVYNHSVLPVIEGTRYAVVSWLR